MEYKILAKIGDKYLNEEGTEGVRKCALEALEVRLTARFIPFFNPNTNKSELRPGACAHAAEAKKFAFEHQVASVGEWGTKNRVAELIKYHEKQQNKWQDLSKANNEVIRIRQWLTRQGAILTPEGRIIWHKSTRTVVYDKDLAAQGKTQLRIVGGLLYTMDDKPFDTTSMVTHFSGPGYAIYVMSREGNFHVSSHSVGNRHHSSLLAGQSVACAGEMKVKEGRLLKISNKSGHYTPDVFHFLQTLHSLWIRSVPMTFGINCLKANGEALVCLDMNDFLKQESFSNATMETFEILRELKPYLASDCLPRYYYNWRPSDDQSIVGELYDVYIPMRKVTHEEVAKKLRQAV